MASDLKWSLSPPNQDTTNINCMLLTSRIGHHLHVWAQYKKLGMRVLTHNGGKLEMATYGYEEGQHVGSTTPSKQCPHTNPNNHQHGMHTCRSSPHSDDWVSECVWRNELTSWTRGPCWRRRPLLPCCGRGRGRPGQDHCGLAACFAQLQMQMPGRRRLKWPRRKLRTPWLLLLLLLGMDRRGGRWRWRWRRRWMHWDGKRERWRAEAGAKAERPNNIHIHYAATASKVEAPMTDQTSQALCIHLLRTRDTIVGT